MELRPKKILLVKLDHIGDFILSLPSIKLVQETFPDAKITLLVGTWNMSIANRLSGIHKVLTFDFFSRISEQGMPEDLNSKIPKLRKLLSDNYDIAIDLRRHPETRGTLLLTNAPIKVGYEAGNRGIDSRLHEYIMPPWEHHINSIPHISEQIYHLVNTICKSNKESRDIPDIIFTDKETNDIKKKYSYTLSRPLLIGMNPGVGSLIRQWPIDYYAELANLFIEKSGAHIVLFGSETERRMIDSVINKINDKSSVTNMVGELNISRFMIFIKHCHLFIGNNSGSGHISGIMNVPTLIVFSGQVMASEWHPLGKNTYLIKKQLDCVPCYLPYKQSCQHKLECLTSITPEEVYLKGMEIISERNITTQG